MGVFLFCFFIILTAYFLNSRVTHQNPQIFPFTMEQLSNGTLSSKQYLTQGAQEIKKGTKQEQEVCVFVVSCSLCVFVCL